MEVNDGSSSPVSDVAKKNACDDMMTKAARDHLNPSLPFSLVHILAGMRIRKCVADTVNIFYLLKTIVQSMNVASPISSLPP